MIISLVPGYEQIKNEYYGDVKMTIYDDLYVRDNFGDTGVVPSSGNPYQSPDIIPYQNAVLTWDYANSTYSGPDIGKAIINGGVNNIFVRAKNLNGSVAGSGTVELYYSKASVFLLTNKWTQVQSAGGDKSLPFVNGSGSTSISPGGIALSNPSFYLTGLPPVSGTHYCLIAVVQTTAHPVTIPKSFTSNAAFALWVQNNPAVGWRNISYAPNTKTEVSRIFGFGNVNKSPAYFTFIIVGRGFVTGTKINCQCTDQNCPVNVDLSLPKPDTQGNQIVTFTTSVPSGFWGDMVITATSPSGPFPPDATLTMSYYQVPNMSDNLEKVVARRFVTASGVKEDSTFTTSMLIKLGECTIRMTDDPQRIG